MMHNMVHPQEILLPFEEISSRLGGAPLEFSESELFPETLQSSEVASISSNNCCYHEEHSSYNPTNNLSITMDDMNNYNNTTIHHDTTTSPPPANQPIFFEDDQLDNDISASIDFTPSPSFSLPNHHQYFNNHNNNNNNNNNNNQEMLFSMSSTFNNNIQISLGDDVGPRYMHDQHNPERLAVASAVEASLIPTGYNEESCGFMSSVSLPSYNIRLMSGIDPMNIGSYFSSNSLSAPFSFDSSGINFTAGSAGLFLGNDHLSVHQELEYKGGNINGGFFQPDSMARVFNCSTGDLQALSSESQHLLHGSPSTTLASEISSLEDPTFKVGKLSVEERKRKIHRYMKKRNERNFSKKIKYACRKTLADSRPRVRGRFAKNDELAEIARTSNGTNHEDDADEDVVSLFSNQNIPDRQHKAVKGEEDLNDSDIFAHISGVNSFKCNYPIQSWI